jgi:hypothetical protein
MARNTWQIEKWNGAIWISDGTIYRPNANVDLDFSSTQSKVKLANGGNAFITPETLYNTEDITFEFLELEPTDSFYTQIIDYIKNQDYLRITTHLNETLTGKFTTIKRVWLSGVDDTFDFQVTFQRMD